MKQQCETQSDKSVRIHRQLCFTSKRYVGSAEMTFLSAARAPPGVGVGVVFRFLYVCRSCVS